MGKLLQVGEKCKRQAKEGKNHQKRSRNLSKIVEIAGTKLKPSRGFAKPYMLAPE